MFMQGASCTIAATMDEARAAGSSNSAEPAEPAAGSSLAAEALGRIPPSKSAATAPLVGGAVVAWLAGLPVLAPAPAAWS
jgi:hypothetical protein